jgi:hypothetical protein
VLVALLSLSLVLTGCTATRLVPLSQAPAMLEAGDSIEVTLKSGELKKLKFLSIDAETLTGREQRASRAAVQIALSEVQVLEQRRFSAGRSLGAMAGVVVGVLAVLVGLIYYVESCPDDDCDE